MNIKITSSDVGAKYVARKIRLDFTPRLIDVVGIIIFVLVLVLDELLQLIYMFFFNPILFHT